LDRLPLTAVRKRREAREMAARWRERVSEAERTQYGAGILGALLLFLSERRLPVTAYQAGRILVRVGVGLAVAMLALMVAVLVAAGAVAVELLSLIL
jgi:hypothetical protein